MKSSNGGQTGTGGERRHWATEAKEKAGALDTLLAEHGVATVAELNERLRGVVEPTPTTGPSPADYAASVTVSAEPQFKNAESEYLTPSEPPPPDPLAWITAGTQFVEIVSSCCVFGLVAAKDARGKGAIDLPNYGSGPWGACPFSFRSEDRQFEENQRVMKDEWWNHRFRRELAEMVYEQKGRLVPTDAVIGVEDYKGWDRMTRAARGTRTPLTEFVPLREEVRRLLQRHTDTFINWNYHRNDIDPRIPNPYKNRVTDIGGHILPEVKNWSADARRPAPQGGAR